jgi:hypothetical protein
MLTQQQREVMRLCTSRLIRQKRSDVLQESTRGRSREHAAGVLSPQPMHRCFGVAVLCGICGEGRAAQRSCC